MNVTIASKLHLKGALFKEICQRFKLSRASFLSKGSTGFVFIMPTDTQKVIKFTVDESAIKYYKYCMRHKNNANLPKVYSIEKVFEVEFPDSCSSHNLVMKPIWKVVMKRYTRLLPSSSNWKMLSAIKKGVHADLSTNIQEAIKTINNLCNKSGKFVSRFDNKTYAETTLDLSVQNVMQDENNNLILTDPVVSRWFFDLRK